MSAKLYCTGDWVKWNFSSKSLAMSINYWDYLGEDTDELAGENTELYSILTGGGNGACFKGLMDLLSPAI